MLAQQLQSIANTLPGTIGLSALHLESNQLTSINANTFFPMASTFKVFLAAHCLALAEEDYLNLQETIKIKETDLRDGTPAFADQIKPKMALTISSLLQRMMKWSDNTATDILLKLSGSNKALQKRIEQWGIQGVFTKNSTLKVLSILAGIQKNFPNEECTLEEFKKLEAEVPTHMGEQLLMNYLASGEDTTTPAAMVLLLKKLYFKEILKTEETLDLLWQAMSQCKTGLHRIRALLPKDILVYDKTGTFRTVTNNVAMLTLPNNKGHIALAIYTRCFSSTLEQRERIIAELAKSICDYYLNYA